MTEPPGHLKFSQLETVGFPMRLKRPQPHLMRNNKKLLLIPVDNGLVRGHPMSCEGPAALELALVPALEVEKRFGR